MDFASWGTTAGRPRPAARSAGCARRLGFAGRGYRRGMSEDQLQPYDSLDDRGVDDVLDEGISPPERPRGVNATGVTALEQAEGETLDERVAMEEPEVWEDAE